jgi:hypothetical protein
LAVPGLAEFSAKCYPVGNPSSGPHSYGVLFLNTISSGGIYASEAATKKTSNGTFSIADAAQVSQGVSFSSSAYNDVSGATEVATWQVNPATGAIPVATVVTSIMFNPGGDCVFRASYVENG